MSASKIILPVDTGNTGKLVRTNRRTVGADNVEEHYFIPISERQRTGVYVINSGVLAVQAAAHASLAGFFWIINPIGSSILMAIRRVEFSSQTTAVTAMLTAPRISVERVTFTGTASGASITPVQIDTAQAAAQGSVRTASTGLTLATVGANAVAYAFLPLVILTGVGVAVPNLQEWEPNEEAQLVIRPGQGAVVRQPDAGTAADTRRFEMDAAWEEYTVP